MKQISKYTAVLRLEQSTASAFGELRASVLRTRNLALLGGALFLTLASGMAPADGAPAKAPSGSVTALPPANNNGIYSKRPLFEIDSYGNRVILPVGMPRYSDNFVSPNAPKPTVLAANDPRLQPNYVPKYLVKRIFYPIEANIEYDVRKQLTWFDRNAKSNDEPLLVLIPTMDFPGRQKLSEAKIWYNDKLIVDNGKAIGDFEVYEAPITGIKYFQIPSEKDDQGYSTGKFKIHIKGEKFGDYLVPNTDRIPLKDFPKPLATSVAPRMGVLAQAPFDAMTFQPFNTQAKLFPVGWGTVENVANFLENKGFPVTIGKDPAQTISQSEGAVNAISRLDDYTTAQIFPLSHDVKDVIGLGTLVCSSGSAAIAPALAAQGIGASGYSVLIPGSAEPHSLVVFTSNDLPGYAFTADMTLQSDAPSVARQENRVLSDQEIPQKLGLDIIRRSAQRITLTIAQDIHDEFIYKDKNGKPTPIDGPIGGYISFVHNTGARMDIGTFGEHAGTKYKLGATGSAQFE